MATIAAVSTTNTDPYASRERHHNEGHGRRLTAAFEALEAFPVLVESRNRVMRLFEAGEPATADIVAAVEADVALAVAVMRLANQVDGRAHGRVESAVKGVEVLTPRSVLAIASRARTFDFFERTAVWQGIPERFRLHAVATQRAADRLARELNYEFRDRLMVTSLLHDIGKLVLVHAYPGYPRQVHGEARTPEDRIQRERRELGVDHALVGGVLARRWGLPRTVAAVIERHHAEDCRRRVGDHPPGGHAGPLRPRRTDQPVGVAGGRPHGRASSRPSSGTVMYDLPLPTRAGGRARSIRARCPRARSRSCGGSRRGWSTSRSRRELGLSTSTVRTHLHNVYGKLGAMDRAQAVLIATERGWI